MKIITESQLRKMLKKSYERGLNIGYDIGYQARKMDEHNRGAIIPGYDIDKDLDEILERKRVN